MTLEELKAAWDAAKAAFEAKPDDKALEAKAAEAEKAYNDAKAAEDAKSKEAPKEGEDDPKWDENTKAYIKKLRDENASHRTKGKDLASKLKEANERTKAILKAAGIEDESEKPEEKLKTLTAQSETLALRNAVLESAVQHGISGEDVEFFEFLITKALSQLEEGEELSDEILTKIVTQVKKQGGKGASSSVGGKGGSGGQPPPGDSGKISLDDFCRMGMMAKTELYNKDPKLYQALMDEAKAKRKLV
jgi:hypothetical protein